jgi:predicted  nucleic acid-binding Zn-ribbon protein
MKHNQSRVLVQGIYFFHLILQELVAGNRQMTDLKRHITNSRVKAASMSTYAKRDMEELTRRGEGYDKLKVSYGESIERRDRIQAELEKVSNGMDGLEEENAQVGRDLARFTEEAEKAREELKGKVGKVDETMFTSFQNISELLSACINEQRELDTLESFITENGIEDEV